MKVVITIMAVVLIIFCLFFFAGGALKWNAVLWENKKTAGSQTKTELKMDTIKDLHGNTLRLVNESEFYPEKSRFKVGYDFYDAEGRITLFEYKEAVGLLGDNYEWEVFCEPYGRGSYRGRMTEKRVLKLTGLWITNSITGETYEYTDENPAGVGRPSNLKDGLR